MKMIQGHASRDVAEGGKREPRPYAINQHFPSQLGTVIDPKARERFRLGEGFVPALGPTDGMDQGPGANREVKAKGSQGSY
jgi:hypothetical protein